MNDAVETAAYFTQTDFRSLRSLRKVHNRRISAHLDIESNEMMMNWARSEILHELKAEVGKWKNDYFGLYILNE